MDDNKKTVTLKPTLEELNDVMDALIVYRVTHTSEQCKNIMKFASRIKFAIMDLGDEEESEER